VQPQSQLQQVQSQPQLQHQQTHDCDALIDRIMNCSVCKQRLQAIYGSSSSLGEFFPVSIFDKSFEKNIVNLVIGIFAIFLLKRIFTS
jgi:aminopeptidase-like protein